MRTRRGATLAELLVVVAIIGVLAVVALPRLQFGALHRKQAEITAAKIASDLRLVRSLAIANAATNNQGFELDMVGGSPYATYKIKNRATNEIVRTCVIDLNVACSGTSRFEFGPLGDIEGDHAELTVSGDGKTVTISVVRATGMVRCE